MAQNVYMINAIEDALIGLLENNAAFSAIRLFVRGGVPLGLASDRYPFCEVLVAQETQDVEYSGPPLTSGVKTCAYHGLLSFSVNLQGSGQADWLRVLPGTRRAVVGSYDQVKAFVIPAQLELQRPVNANLSNLAVSYQVQDLSVAEVVVLLMLNGALVFGMEQRRDNYSNFGSVPFLVETRRTVTNIPQGG